jgi:hypothetical protein
MPMQRQVEARTSQLESRGTGVRCAQLLLIDLFCDYRPDPNAGLYSAAPYGEFAAVDRLLGRGAKPDLVVTAAIGRCDEARAFVSAANNEF